MNMLSTGPARIAAFTATVLALSAGTGAAFAAWLGQAPDIYMALVETGLSWCF